MAYMDSTNERRTGEVVRFCYFMTLPLQSAEKTIALLSNLIPATEVDPHLHHCGLCAASLSHDNTHHCAAITTALIFND